MGLENSGKYLFVQESSNRQKIKIFFVSLLLLIVIVSTITFAFLFFKESMDRSAPILALKSFINNEVKNVTPIGLFYLSFTGAFFFLFAPVELFFVIGLRHGNPVLISIFYVLAGMIPAHAVNYFVGSRFGSIILNFVSKKKVYGIRRKINKYGPYAILFFNILPLPADILTLALGMTKYNIIRLYTFMISGAIIKFTAIALFYKSIF